MNYKQTTGFLLEVALLTALFVVTARFGELWGPPMRRGFFCDDASLQLPYRPNTVDQRLLYAIGLYAPLALIGGVELLLAVAARRPATADELRRLLGRVYRAASAFLLGYACERLFKSVAKHGFGRLRPHFFAVCQPRLPDGSSCADHRGVAGFYVAEYTCAGVNATAAMLRNVHVSFPSGHAGLACYGMVFAALYLQRRLTPTSAFLRLLRPLLQLGLLMVAWFVGLSRITDHMHHWSDVLAGAALGSSMAAFVFLAIGDFHRGEGRSRGAEDDGVVLKEVTCRTQEL